MKSNKEAKLILDLPSGWDQGRVIFRQLNNNVVVSLDASRRYWLLDGWVKGSKNKSNS